MSNEQELEKDIKQLKKFLLEAQSQRICDLLASQISRSKTQLQLLKIKPIPLTQEQVFEKNQQHKQYIPITKYTWQQIEDTTKLKILVPLSNVGKQCKQDQCKANFQKTSVQFKIQNWNGKHYVFSIPKLYGQIQPQKCKLLLKQNQIVLSMNKKYPIGWLQIYFKKDIFHKTKQQKKKKGNEWTQQDELMDMVKKIYEDGDPKMQKAIKQAFATSQDKKRQKYAKK